MLPLAVLQGRVRWEIAAIRVEQALLRLRLALRAYNPGQLRVPAGNPDGGQWTRGEGTGTEATVDDARIVLVSGREEPRYSVVLQEEETRGGTRSANMLVKPTSRCVNAYRKAHGAAFCLVVE